MSFKFEHAPQPAPSRTNKLEYLASMAIEMKALAQSADAPMLSGLFDLAHKEAMEQLTSARSRLKA